MIAFSASILLLSINLLPPNEDPIDRVSATAKEVNADSPDWPAIRIARSLLHRWVVQDTHRFDLSADQRERWTQKILDRWTRFLERNRDQFEPLLAQYLTIRTASNPPGPKEIKKLSQKARAALELIRRELDESNRELSAIVNDDQRAQFQDATAQARARLQSLSAKVDVLGRADLSDEQIRQTWRQLGLGFAEPPLRIPATDPQVQLIAKRRIDEELELWDKFVADFVQRYALADAQAAAAQSVLRECKQRARNHYQKHRGRLEHLENDIEVGGPATDTRRLEIIALYSPIDSLFAELRTRLEHLPTTAQVQIPHRTEYAPNSPATRDNR